MRLTDPDQTALNQTGLNLIRIVIGSYFIGVALDLVDGVDQKALFAPFLSPEFADMMGSMLLFFISVLFMTGMFLRLSSLALCLFVLCSSVVQNFLPFTLSGVSGFWRDLTLACAVLLSYSPLDRRGLHRARVLHRARRIRRVRSKPPVIPRRISTHPPDGHETIRQSELLARKMPGLARGTGTASSDGEITNIFADV